MATYNFSNQIFIHNIHREVQKGKMTNHFTKNNNIKEIFYNIYN